MHDKRWIEPGKQPLKNTIELSFQHAKLRHLCQDAMLSQVILVLKIVYSSAKKIVNVERNV